MDKFNELTTGAKLVLASAVALLIVSFFDWFEVADIAGENMWNGIGLLAGLLLLALIVWLALRMANVNLELGVSPSMITAALSALTLLFVIIRFIDKPGGGLASDVIDRTIWAWLGLALAILLVVGAWLNMQSAGEGLSDIRSSVSGAAASARGAVNRDEPAPTAPPSTPTQPAAEPPVDPSDPDDTPRVS